MKEKTFSNTDLVLNDDGSVYHLQLMAKHIADTVILVGDQNRVKQISKHFETIEYQIENREFITHTGTYKGKRITAISTGIGTDNVDIVLNELYAAVNINPQMRKTNATKKSLNLIRIGTSGALHADIPVDSFVVSTHGLGLDGLMYYYNFNFSKEEMKLADQFNKQISWPKEMAKPYVVGASEKLFSVIGDGMQSGITATGTGFYGPQGRSLLDADVVPVQDKFQQFEHKGIRVTNFDMETSALYGLGRLFGFECCTINAIIANRVIKEYSNNHILAIDKLILTVLNRIKANL